jgi:predicted RNA-binding Zn-ribbon protein involved in translation (DUF1610 family)
MYRDDDYGGDDWEMPERDEDDDEELDLLPCPSCGEPIYEEAEACPYCGEYVTHSTSVLASKPLWFVVLAILGIVAIIFALVH